MHRSLLTALACLTVVAGCSSSGSDYAVLTVDQALTLADQPVHLKVTGLHPNKPVTVGADAVGRDAKKWHGEATFTADDHGSVELDTAKPTSGSYQSVDGMGLFWSMDPADGDPDAQTYNPPLDNGRLVEKLEISASRDGKRLASTTVTRLWRSSGVTPTSLTMAKDKLTGVYVATKADGAKHPAVLWLGGSEGGTPSALPAYLLASHGYPVLALAYFHAPGLPDDLRNVPLEYFASAARWLQRQPGVDPTHVILMGGSYGTEAALLAADHFPTLIHGLVLLAPSATATASFPEPDGSAWTYAGKPVAFGPIPVDGVNGPVLAVAGSADLVWQSRSSAQRIMQALDDAHDKFPHEALLVDDAGHRVVGAPYLPQGTTEVHPATGTTLQLGGSRLGDESALRQGWTKTLALLGSLS
ncbi:acyl-CoA thioesterase/BAAT N-terminal domain-containing protein [Kribbella sp. CA-245084]|uniref:acyl-CoA thioesterase/BAAT N-terminal domain-containing protein n=1 Tax=Kribbella sp. CA-245084 TaxID=3239940 RepID=UPI003D935F58